jgi:hypothetical protein
MSNVNDPPHLWNDGAFVVEISQHGAKICDYLDGLIES